MRKLILIAGVAAMCGGCKTSKSFSPFAKESVFDAVFGYPPKVIASCLAIEEDLPYRPADLRNAQAE
jgi:hypothetical protein